MPKSYDIIKAIQTYLNDQIAQDVDKNELWSVDTLISTPNRLETEASTNATNYLHLLNNVFPYIETISCHTHISKTEDKTSYLFLAGLPPKDDPANSSSETLENKTDNMIILYALDLQSGHHLAFAKFEYDKILSEYAGTHY